MLLVIFIPPSPCPSAQKKMKMKKRLVMVGGPDFSRRKRKRNDIFLPMCLTSAAAVGICLLLGINSIGMVQGAKVRQLEMIC